MARRIRSREEAERWCDWMHGLGASTRRLRTLLGLTQEQLGRLAGVSQGAVSRLEGGRGLSTPLMVVVRIQQAFQQCLARIDPRQLSADAQAALAHERSGVLETLDDVGGLRMLQAPHLAEYMELWHRVHPRRRNTFLDVVRATAEAMRSMPAADVDSAGTHLRGADAPAAP
ncbi:MAG: helix-turn-helix domain-containing protein [bacterium]|nr:helix-turn-helix domain-containing protein [bacterium]